MESIGVKLRQQRMRLGLTLDELAGRTGISKPYLSLIETGRTRNPPSDDKLRLLEQSLGFSIGELIHQAHLQRTPRDVRVMLQKLMDKGINGDSTAPAPPKAEFNATPLNLDDAFLSGLLRELVNNFAGTIESVAANAVPVINRVSAGYPTDFTDLSYPRGVADSYVGCPEVTDKDAFAARVHGDSMNPRYQEGDIIIFSPAQQARDGDDCFIRFSDGQTTFKRIFFETDDSGASVIRLQPRNEKYRPQVVPTQQITGLFKAVYRYQRVD